MKKTDYPYIHTMDEIVNNWAILDEHTISETDYIFGSDLLERLENITPDKYQYEYNQRKWEYTRNGCTIFMALWAISDMTGYKFSDDEILDICKLCEAKYGWSPSWGNYLHKSVDCVRNWWNAKFPDNKLVSFRFRLDSQEGQRLLDSNKTVCIWFHTSVKHYNDAQDNGNLDSETFAWAEKGGGHAVRINNYKTIDNYSGWKKYNKYGTKKILSYVQDGTYFPHAYVFFEQKKSIKKLLENIKLERARKAQLLGIWNGDNPSGLATREQVAAMIYSAIARNIDADRLTQVEDKYREIFK